MLQAEGIKSGYFGSEVLHGINLSAMDGKIVLLVGPNGAGKSTLMSTFLGLLKPSAGKVHFKGREITNVTTSERIKLGISFVPQGGNIFPAMSVRENLEMGAYLMKDPNYVKKRISEIIGIFPFISERLQQKAGLLSGGERQMLSIGRSLMMSPSLLLLDEPSSGLDVGKQQIIFGRLAELNRNGLGILLVEQNVREVSKIAHYVYAMTGGLIRYEGEPSILNDKEVLSKIFFGSAPKKVSTRTQKEVVSSNSADTH